MSYPDHPQGGDDDEGIFKDPDYSYQQQLDDYVDSFFDFQQELEDMPVSTDSVNPDEELPF